MVKKYVKLEEVEAIQFNGKNITEIKKFVKATSNIKRDDIDRMFTTLREHGGMKGMYIVVDKEDRVILWEPDLFESYHKEKKEERIIHVK